MTTLARRPFERSEKMGADPLKPPKTKGSDPFFSERS
jgi:hypothetical protein